jgi:hypothetical protein
VNDRDSTMHDEDGWLVGMIKRLHELVFKLLLEGKKNLGCSFRIWGGLGDCFVLHTQI